MNNSGEAEPGEYDGPRCPYRCECGIITMRKNKKGHEQSKKHHKFMVKKDANYRYGDPVVWTKLTLKWRW